MVRYDRLSYGIVRVVCGRFRYVLIKSKRRVIPAFMWICRPCADETLGYYGRVRYVPLGFILVRCVWIVSG